MDARLGELLTGRYRPTAVIGRGGMGCVYRARDETLGREVAIKLFGTQADPREIGRQKHEVNLLAGLSHHGLVTIFDAAIDDSDSGDPRIYFVMELVDGADLAQVLARTSLRPRQVAQLGFDLAEGLQYIHRRGVVHRDLKPSNVLVVDFDDDGLRTRAKLTDFGIALTSHSARLTADGMTTGTAAYLSPEQAQKFPVGPASDIYSLGLVLLECFTGRATFPGDPIPSALARLLADPDIPTDISPEWRELLKAMTARRAEERPSADDVVAALGQMMTAGGRRHRNNAGHVDAGPVDAGICFLDHATLVSVADRVAAIAGRSLSASVATIRIGSLERMWVDRELGLSKADVAALLTRPSTGHPDLAFSLAASIAGSDGRSVGTLEVFGDAFLGSAQDRVDTVTDLAALVTDVLGSSMSSSAAMPDAASSAPNVTTLTSRRAERHPTGDAQLFGDIPARG